MTFTDSVVMQLEDSSSNLINRPRSRVQNKKIWKSLRSHILFHRQRNEKAAKDAEVLIKKIRLQNQKLQEHKLSLAQINGRLFELQCKRDELVKEKRVLLEQKLSSDHTGLRELKSEGCTVDSANNINRIHTVLAKTCFPPQQTLSEVLNTQPDAIPSMLVRELDPSTIVIPTKVNGGSRPNYWIIHNPV